MSETQKEDASQLERQWLLLEEHYKNDKPIAARILEIAKGRVLVDVGGIQGSIEAFVYAFTEHSTKEAVADMPPLTE